MVLILPILFYSTSPTKQPVFVPIPYLTPRTTLNLEEQHSFAYTYLLNPSYTTIPIIYHLSPSTFPGQRTYALSTTPPKHRVQLCHNPQQPHQHHHHFFLPLPLLLLNNNNNPRNQDVLPSRALAEALLPRGVHPRAPGAPPPAPVVDAARQLPLAPRPRAQPPRQHHELPPQHPRRV